MKKILSLLLALLLVLSVALTACTTNKEENNTEKEHENSTAPAEESKADDESSESQPSEETTGSKEEETTGPKEEETTAPEEETSGEPSMELPTIAKGDIIHVIIHFPGFIEENEINPTTPDNQEQLVGTTIRTYFDNTLEVEYHQANHTFQLLFTSDCTEELRVGFPNELTAYYDGTYVYMTIKTGDTETTAITTPEVAVRSLFNQAGGTIPDTMLEELEELFDKLLNGKIDDIVGEVNPETLINMLPEEYQALIRQIMELLPEGKVELPEASVPEINPDDLLAALLGLLVKTEEKDGAAVYTFDFTTVTTALTGLLDQVPTLLATTPAALIDQIAGKEGTYEQFFLLLSTSIKGDTTVGSLLDNIALALNTQGFRITDEKIIKLIETIAKLAGQEFAEGQVEELYKNLRKATLDELLATIPSGEGGSDTPLTVAKVMETLNTFMTKSTIADLINMISPEGSETVLAVANQIKEVLGTVSGSLSFHENKDNAIYRFVFALKVGKNINVSVDVNISDTSVMPAPKGVQDLSGVTVTETADGNVQFAGLPANAKVDVELSGSWYFMVQETTKANDFFRTENINNYVTVNGSSTTVLINRLKQLPDQIFQNQLKDIDSSATYYFTYRMTITITIEIGDRTAILLYPVLVDYNSFTNDLTARF